ncbi:MAG: succinyldiaminopimelate transaminase [Gammaproteobacteria bacterium]|nr:succinyldiaminopimelate transaminase [Gammaproteobacteria bacterium]MCW9006022.1 succinyldiaminopimelate transaminase [Gammaproteobacteria bacterium]
MNPDLNRLQPYPFEKLADLKKGITPVTDKAHIALSIGEPKHQPPAFVLDKLASSLDTIGQYPLTKGTLQLRNSIANWLISRFKLGTDAVNPETQILPVNGTREALFAFAQAVIDRNKNPHILMPNPFYQIYEGAAYLAGARPVFYNTTKDTGYLPDFDAISEADWQQCQLLYICTPGNPTGAVIPKEQLKNLIEKAEKYDFIIASDECYSEIYFDENYPPPGLLEAAKEMGNDDFKRCIVFHSLSKRSNLPGLRSGFVAGDADIIQSFFQYRTYHGCAMPPATQAASISAWSDEQHVIDNRLLYKTKFNSVVEILSPVLDVTLPDAGFYLWPQTPILDTDFAQNLFAEQNVTVLPGQFLSRDSHNINPGKNHIRMALVATVDETVEAARRIHQFVEKL